MSNSVDTMKNFFNVIKLYSEDPKADGVGILDHAVRTTTRFAGLQDAINNFISDVTSGAKSYGIGTSLLQNCGILIGAEGNFTADTGAVSGYNAGMGVVKNAQDIVPEPDVKLSELELPAENSVVNHSYTGADGQTFNYTITYPETYLTVRDNSTSPLGEDGYPDSCLAQSTTLQEGETYNTLNDDKSVRYSAPYEQTTAGILTMLRGVENFWIDESLKLAYDSFGLDFDGKNLTIIFGINQWSQAETGPIASDTAGREGYPATSIEMEINSVTYAYIDPDNVNGSTRVANGTEQNYLDRTIAHELIHAVMQAHGLIKETMPEFFTEGVAELVHGLDDYDSNYYDILVGLAADSDRLTKAMVLKAGTGTIDAYPAGDMFLRYLCQQSRPVNVKIGTVGEAQTFTHESGQDIISVLNSGDTIQAGADVQFTNFAAVGNDVFVQSNVGSVIIRDGYSKVVNFTDANGAVIQRAAFAAAGGGVNGKGLFGETSGIIYGANYANEELIAGDGGSTLWGGDYGDDILHGGTGADTFITGTYCGNDIIYNANAEDVISLAATSLEQITGTNVSAGGVYMTFSDGSSLNVIGKTEATFMLADGTSYKADQSSGTFNQLSA